MAMLAALGVVIIWVLVCVHLLQALGMDALLIGLVAQAPYAVFSIVHQSVAQRRFEWNPASLPQGIVTLDRFALPWRTMLAYGTLLIAFGTQLEAVLGAFLSGDVAIGNLFGLAGALITSYWFGHWSGVRIDRLGLVVVPLTVILARIITMLTDYVVLTDLDFEQYLGIHRDLRQLAATYLGSTAVLVTFVSVVAAGLIGFWLGRRARLSRYLWYLLSQLPITTRDSVAELVYEEVQRLTLLSSHTRLPPAPP